MRKRPGFPLDADGPMKPVLGRPDAEWDFYCVNGCYACVECHKIFRYDETCPHDPRDEYPVASLQAQ